MIIINTPTPVPTPRPAGRRARRRFGWADLFGPLGIASAVAVLCLWIVDHGTASLWNPGTTLQAIGTLAGLLASDFLLLLVIMMARIPWVERAWGHDLLARRHRWIGFASFWLLLIHIGANVARSSLADPNWWRAMTGLFVTQPWMLWASAGTIAILLIVFTSARAARRRLRYESWHLLHLYAYLGVGLALPHQIADGDDFHSPAAQIYWWSLFGLAAAATIAFRIAVPIIRSAQVRMRVTSVTHEAHGVVSIELSGHRLGRLQTRAGQFFIWRFLDGPGWMRGNPYTISDAPTDDRMRITIQAAGDGSARAAKLSVGTRVLIEGPYGTLTSGRRSRPHALLIAAGVGITPMTALLAEDRFRPGEATVIYRYSSAQHAVLLEELQRRTGECGARLILLPGPRRTDGSWLPEGVEQADPTELQRLAPDLATSDIYVCGPPNWVSSVKRAARHSGVQAGQLHSEDFAW